ncbi:MAG: sel1 repeat family protein [Bacteroidales bacterium]|nr:sel1 repeat family protein [Bacteroidales bacterium]
MKRHIPQLIIFIIVMFLGIPKSNAQTISEESKLELVNLYNQSQQYLSEGNYDKAIELKTQMYNKAKGLQGLEIMSGMPAFEIAHIYSVVRNDLDNYILWLKRAVECNFPGASGRLGDAYLTGEDGVKQDFQKAKYYYEKSDEGRCLWIIATMYGPDGELGRNDSEWWKYANKATEKGDPNAQFALGICYLSGKYYGEKIVNKDYNKGVELIKKAAQQNYIKAIKFLEEQNIH